MAPSDVGAMWKVEARKVDSPLGLKILQERQEAACRPETTKCLGRTGGDDADARVAAPSWTTNELDSVHNHTKTDDSNNIKQKKQKFENNNPWMGVLKFFGGLGNNNRRNKSSPGFGNYNNNNNNNNVSETVVGGRRIRLETDATTGVSPVACTSTWSSTHAMVNCSAQDDAILDTTASSNRVSSPVAISGSRVESEKAPPGGVRMCSGRGAGDPEDQGGGDTVDGANERVKREVQYSSLRGCASKRVSFTEENFVPCYATFTPKLSCELLSGMQYRAPETRVPSAVAPPSSVARPNYHDALRRVAVVVYQHIKTCEWRRREAEERDKSVGGAATQARQRAATGDVLRTVHRDTSALWGEAGDTPRGGTESGYDQIENSAPSGSCREPFNPRKADLFHERRFVAPKFRYKFVQAPVMALPGAMFTLKEVQSVPKPPSVDEIYDFIKTLFNKACLSSECSLVCLIYVERLMETAQVPLLASTWKPILLCGLLLASKVWQDLSSWNVEFSTVYPQYSLKSINRLELLFLGQMRWDMSISSSLYAKYYFALRSLAEKKDFRRRYNQVMKIDAPRATRVQARADAVKRSVTKAQSVSMLSKSL